MRILYVGDVVGRSGRAVLLEQLPGLRASLQLDAVLVNGENAAAGYGLTATGQYMESIGIPYGTVSAFLAGSTEFFGGILLLAGVLIPIVTIPMVVTMLVASFVAHGGGFNAQTGGMEYALTLAVVLAALGLLGGGDWTLERFFKKPARVPVSIRTPQA